MAHIVLHHTPEGCIVQIVDVAVYLPPSEIVLYGPLVRVGNDSTVKCGNFSQGLFEEVAPVENIGRSESGDHTAEDLISSP